MKTSFSSGPQGRPAIVNWREPHRQTIGLRPVADFAIDQNSKQDAQQQIKSHEAKQRKQAVAGRDGIRVAFAGAHQAIDEPGLATKFGGHPAGGVGDVGQRKAEQQRPQCPARCVKTLAPEQKRGDDHQQRKPCSEAGHDVVGIIEQWQCCGPLVVGNLIESFDFGLGRSVDEEAQHIVHHDRIVDLACLFIGLAHQHQARAGFAVEEALHRGDGGWLIARNVLAVQVAGGKDDEDRGDEASDDANLQEDPAILFQSVLQEIKSAHGRHDKRSSNHRTRHIVGVLQQAPGIHQQLPEAEYLELPIGQAIIGDGMLHPGIGDDDEKARYPGTGKDHHRREPMHPFGDAFFAVEKKAQKSRFKKEAEDAFHGQRLANHAAGEAREARPVGAELELHGNAGDHAKDEVDGEDPPPEACCPVPLLAAGFECHRLEHHNQQCQSHGELGEQIVEGNGKGKVQAMDQFSGHGDAPVSGRARGNGKTFLSAWVRLSPE